MINIKKYKEYTGTMANRHSLVSCGYRAYKCFECNGPIAREEKYYNIASCIPVPASPDWSQPERSEPFYVELLFHSNCFEGLAGEKYSMSISAGEYSRMDLGDKNP